MRAGPLFFALALAAPAAACEWDRDTLADEATLGKDFLAAVVGRFPRNPPLYYSMRRDRLLAKKAKTTGDYDDLAVAYDKLGDPRSALRWIGRKPLGSDESRYRTLANRGTFLVHAWLAGEGGRAGATEGLASLRAAVELNPNAHFGRETVQVHLVEALLDPAKASFAVAFAGGVQEKARREAEGYAGIIRLGAGWESPDVFRAYAVSLANAGLGAVGTAAVDRAEELERQGAKARLDPKDVFPLIEGLQEPGALPEDTRAQFVRLRREADGWQARRTAFMVARLRAGRHPDTDPRFWEGWVDRPPPRIETRTMRLMGLAVTRRAFAGVMLGGAACVAIPLALFAWAIRLGRRAVRIEVP